RFITPKEKSFAHCIADGNAGALHLTNSHSARICDALGLPIFAARRAQCLAIARANQRLRKLSRERKESSRYGARTHHAESYLQIWVGRSLQRRNGLFRFRLLCVEAEWHYRRSPGFERPVRLVAAGRKVRAGDQPEG